MDTRTDELLESYVSVEHWDLLLTRLETLPLYCPPPLVLNVLFTLATLSPYNNDEIINNPKHGIVRTSDRPVHLRALWILQGLVTSVKSARDGPFGCSLDDEARRLFGGRLISSMEFIRGNRARELRTVALKKASYMESADPATPKSKRIVDLMEESPQRRALNRLLQQIPAEDMNGNDDDDELHRWTKTTADAKTLAILNHQRVDIILADGMIWNAIRWALVSSSLIHKPIRQQVWQMWAPLISLFVDILDLELDLYDQLQPVPDLITTKFFEQVGRYRWSERLADAIIPKVDAKGQQRAQEIYKHELTLSRGQFLEPLHVSELKPKLLSIQSIPLRHRLTQLAMKFIEQGGELLFDKCTLHDLISGLSRRILEDGNIDDMLLWYRVDDEDEAMASFMCEMLIHTLVQITTHEFPLPEKDWFTKTDAKFIKVLFENITFERKFYALESEESWVRMQLDFSRINIILFLLFSTWITFAKKVSLKVKLTCLDLANKGEQMRLKVLDSAKKDYNYDNSVHIVPLLKAVIDNS